MTKMETALRVIAGVSPAWAQWKVFFEYEPVPKRDKVVQTAANYQDGLSALVRAEACQWLALRFDLWGGADVDEAEHAYAGAEPLA